MSNDDASEVTSEVGGNTIPRLKDGSRNWCFTLNNYSLDEFEDIKKYKCKYLCIGEEIGDNNTPHLQGYIEFSSVKLFKTLINFNKRIHWEQRKGTAKQASDYCKKDKKYIEIGTISKQGKRTDLDNVADKIISGTSLYEIAETDPSIYIRYTKGLTALKNIIEKDRSEKPTVIWLYGLAGTGKTRYAYDQKHKDIYIKDGTIWWDNYTQQEAIIIDDFDGKWEFRNLLRLLDRYPYQGQIKGGYVKINSPYIYITCEFPPEHFWQNNTLDQIIRRLTNIYNLE